MSDDDPKRVGYKRPPHHSRFPNGTSGNPKGRPKKFVRTFTRRQIRKDVMEIMEEPTAVMVNGRSRTMPLYIVLLRAQMIASAQGKGKIDLSLTNFFIAMVSDHEQANYGVHDTLENAEKQLAAGFDLPADHRILAGLVGVWRRKSRNLG